MTKKMLFYRNYQMFTGGHLKVLDYYRHTRAATGFRVEIHVTPDSRSDHLWRGDAGQVTRYLPAEADALFIGGMDWTALEVYPGIEERLPVINLIQHIRHASPDQPTFQFLSRRATRICVSDEVANALRATGICNGPIHVIPNGVDRHLIPPLDPVPAADVFICGYKRIGLARAVAGSLSSQGLSVDCLLAQVPREEFLRRMSRARIVVLLPHASEGFYLPALEAMAMGSVVICPDCVGNRAFCIDGVSGLVPQHNAAAIEAAVARIRRSPGLAEELGRGALSASMKFTIDAERSAYHRILEELT